MIKKTVIMMVWSLVVAVGIAWAEPYELKTNKSAYQPGETVTIVFKNNSVKQFEPANNWPTITNAAGEVVYSPVTIQILVAVGPGQSKSWEWNQVDNDNATVPPGQYTATLKGFAITDDDTFSGSVIGQTVKTSFTIGGPQSPAPGLSDLAFSTDKPVYQTGGSGKVSMTLKNNGSTIVLLTSHDAWSVKKDGQLVYAPVQLMIWPSPYPLNPGKSMTYHWYKKDSFGLPVPSGSYTIEIGIGNVGGAPLQTLKRTIALTPTGKLAGTGMFPLAVGNKWTYDAHTTPLEIFLDPQSMEVTKKAGSSYLVTNLEETTRWVKMVGSSKPILRVSAGLFTPIVGDFFHFKQPLNHVYTATALGNTKMIVVGVNEVVETPAGKFTGCYRLSTVTPPGLLDGPKTIYTFAPGVGLVRYGTYGLGSVTTTYSLGYAKIKGTDGKWYTIGSQ